MIVEDRSDGFHPYQSEGSGTQSMARCSGLGKGTLRVPEAIYAFLGENVTGPGA